METTASPTSYSRLGKDISMLLGASVLYKRGRMDVWPVIVLRTI